MSKPIDTKKCRECGEEKNVEEFYTVKATKKRPDGRLPMCKSCAVAHVRKHKERYKALSLLRERAPTVQSKVCASCRQTKDASEFHIVVRNRDGLNSSCKPCRNAKARASETKRRATWSTAKRREIYERQRDKASIHNARSRALLRAEVIERYGGRCACCGESAFYFLTIDHINNDGAAHRRQIGRASLYKWLRDNDYPKGFQVLCYNCNCAKGRYGLGVCPHQAQIERLDDYILRLKSEATSDREAAEKANEPRHASTNLVPAATYKGAASRRRVGPS